MDLRNMSEVLQPESPVEQWSGSYRLKSFEPKIKGYD